MPRPFLNIHQKIAIRSGYRNWPTSWFVKEFGCSKSCIQAYRHRAALSLTPVEVQNFRIMALTGRTKFTKEMDAYLFAHWQTVPVKAMANALRVSGLCVATRMRQLRLHVPPQVAQERKRSTRFKKGCTPANKGKKLEEYLTAETLQKVRASQFKKGHEPHNTKEGNGHISVRMYNKTGIGYKYIKVGRADWRPLHRHLYKKHIGPIPKGMMVVFKDGNSLNCDLQNLQLMSKKDNARRNIANYHHMPPELKRSVKLVKTILKTIKEHEH